MKCTITYSAFNTSSQYPDSKKDLKTKDYAINVLKKIHNTFQKKVKDENGSK